MNVITFAFAFALVFLVNMWAVNIFEVLWFLVICYHNCAIYNKRLLKIFNKSNDLIWSTDGKRIYNPTATDIFMDYYGVEYIVPSGKSINF